jgi:heme-degrading monooxygenase HmoA
MHARTARYEYTGNARDLARRAETGLLPIFEAQPGFKAYSLIDTGDEIVSYSAWESAKDAEAASEAATRWVAENVPDQLTLKDSSIGELLLGTALDVSTLARARA